MTEPEISIVPKGFKNTTDTDLLYPTLERLNNHSDKTGSLTKEEYVKNAKDSLYHNPSLVGVYLSLGKNLYNRYEVWGAWACWDTVRQFYPRHPMLKDIDTIEQRLVSDFPDYF